MQYNNWFWSNNSIFSRYHLNFLKIWCDHRTSANTANHPTSDNCEHDCNITNIMYFIFYQNECDFVFHLPTIIFMFQVKTQFDY